MESTTVPQKKLQQRAQSLINVHDGRKAKEVMMEPEMRHQLVGIFHAREKMSKIQKHAAQTHSFFIKTIYCKTLPKM